MSYDKALVSSKQKAMLKSITDLLNVLSEIDIDDNKGNSGEIVLDDGSIMTLSTSADKQGNTLNVERISLTSARLNLDILVDRKAQNTAEEDDTVIRLVKKSPDKIILKKSANHE